MAKGLPKGLQEYVKLTSEYWNEMHPSKETFKQHFQCIIDEAETATDIEELDRLKKFAFASRIHFQELISSRDKDLEDKLKEEYEEAKKEIKKHRDKVYDKVTTVEKETSVRVTTTGGVEITKRKKRQPMVPKDVHTV